MEVNPNLRRLPITIGVTGHMNISPDDIPRAEQEFKSLLHDISRRFPHSPLRLLTSLAEGADRLAARAFIAFRDELAKRSRSLAKECELIGVLPLPESLFEDDFPQSKAEFHQLLSELADCFHIPIRQGANLSDVRHPGEARNTQYQDAGRYVSTHADLLIALWDGLDPGLVGGTADAVRMRLKDNRLSPKVHASPLARSIKQPLHHIKISRSTPSRGAAPQDIFQSQLYSASGSRTLTLLADLKQLDDHNRSLQRFVTPALLKQSMTYAFENKDLGARITGRLTHAEQRCLTHFAAADALASHFEKRWRYMTYLIYGIGLATALSMAFAIENTFLPWSLIAYASLLALAAAIFGLMKFRRIDQQHIESRTLAELLRTQFAWMFSNLEDPSMEGEPTVAENTLMLAPITHLLLGQQQKELGWIFGVMASVTLNRSNGSSRLSQHERMSVIRDWFDGQKKYFCSKAKVYERNASRLKRLASFFVYLGLIAAIVAIAIILIEPQDIAGIDPGVIRQVLIILAAFLPIFAVVIENASERFGFEAQAKVRRRLHEVFDMSAKYMEEARDDLELQGRLTRDAGRESVSEAVNWLFLRRIKPVKVTI